ncbi:MAG: diguanylate cyclase [Rhodospirillaceae bacterium]
MSPPAPSLRPKIVIIDDTPVNIRILHAVLARDFDVRFATSGADGLELVAGELPDLVVLDVMMPEIDGYEVCRRLKADPLLAQIPVIFVTALNDAEDEAKGLEVGAVDYLTKPITPAIVLARVKTHVELKRLRDRLELQSTTDGLTGVANRRGFDACLVREWQRAARARNPLSLILADIDFFKLYNDHYGHLAGDICLRKVAQAMADTVSRPADLVARYGGEEFVALLPETDALGARVLAEEMRGQIAALAINHATSLVADHVTLSLGVTTLVPDGHDDPTYLILQADEALYLAKNQGRDRVVARVVEAAGAASPVLTDFEA